jgi:release factor glutamine methyltransferase
MTRREAVSWASQLLRQADVEAPEREARRLLAHAAGLDLAGLLLDPVASVADEAAYRALVARRAAREPLALIVGQRGFWTLDLLVSGETLVPRPETETLVEAVLALGLPRDSALRALDLGTGTGCLLLAVLSEFPRAFGVGVDLAPGAALLARENAARCGLAGRAAFLVGDWAEALAPGGFDLVLSNPPYVSRTEMAALMPEVALYEPRRALEAGEAGLDAYARILPDLTRLLRPGGIAVLELGAGQEKAVSALAEAGGLVLAGMRSDLTGVSRALVLRGSTAKKPFGTESP